MNKETAVKVNGLHKIYPSGVHAVEGLSFNIDKGEIYALIGPNGAGKTTTLRIIATLIKPSNGKVNIFGVDVLDNPNEVRKMISYLPEEAGAYRNLKGIEYLKFMAGFYSRGSRSPEDIAGEAAEISGLGERLLDKIKTYSKGMKRRLQIARTLAPHPMLAILDEPTSGLDVMASMEIRDTIKKYREKYGITILLSSHNMLEVEYLSDRVGIIFKGKLLAEGAPSDILERTGAHNLEEAFRFLIREVGA
ncbi:MAG: ABC transporter ATP-binding protein [Desulfurococcales archaeon]|nr:ABC transporter ATP-binding protein [Desulfurococcales archaeon]